MSDRHWVNANITPTIASSFAYAAPAVTLPLSAALLTLFAAGLALSGVALMVGNRPIGPENPPVSQIGALRRRRAHRADPPRRPPIVPRTADARLQMNSTTIPARRGA